MQLTKTPADQVATLPLQARRYSQHFTAGERADDGFVWPTGGPEEWAEKCCGLACLRTLLDYYGLPVPSQREMLVVGLHLDAYTPRGWDHRGLVRVAQEYGLTGYAEGYDDQSHLQRLAAGGTPSIISCTWQFPQDGRTGGHLVVFTGEFDRGGETYAGFADPSRFGVEHSWVPAERFWSSWSGRGIVLAAGGAPT